MALETYYDFAENDYLFLKEIIEENRFCNGLASMSQNVCERYLKHIIDTYYIPQNQEETDKKNNALKAHNLNKICKFLKNEMNIDLSKECQYSMKIIDGFYYTSRYPGDESVDIDLDDMKDCLNAMTICRETVLQIIEKKNTISQELAGNSEIDEDIEL